MFCVRVTIFSNHQLPLPPPHPPPIIFNPEYNQNYQKNTAMDGEKVKSQTITKSVSTDFATSSENE